MEINQILNNSRQFTSLIQKMEGKFRLPMGVEQYLSFANSLQQINTEFSVLNIKGEKTQAKVKDDDILVRVAKNSIVDAELIANFHKELYRGHYPYHEMLDLEYLKENILSPEKGFCELFGIHENGEEKTTGCAILSIDEQKQTGYIRGLTVLPKYQGKMNVKDLVRVGIKYGFNTYSNVANKWYTETRTQHSKGQFLIEVLGFRPCAIFPNKDIFFGGSRRESDVLHVTYNDITLYELRNSEPKLTPYLADLYEFIAGRYNLEEAIIENLNILDETYADILNKAKKIEEKISVSKEESKYNRIYYDLQTEKGSSLKFMVTRTVKSAEKAELVFKSYEDLIALLIRLDEIMKEDDIEYFELYFPATDPLSQEMFLSLNFSVFGYVPAWYKNESEKLDDCIIFGKYRQNLDPDELHLTGSAYDFLQVIEQYLH